MGQDISVRIKFFSGIDKELSLKSYDPARGIELQMRPGRRLRWALKSLGVADLSRNIYFRSGERVSTWARLRDGDEISCLRPSGGG